MRFNFRRASLIKASTLVNQLVNLSADEKYENRCAFFLEDREQMIMTKIE